LSSRALHSVRDSYTEEKLRSIGITNVINTGCPTMWPLARQKPEDIPCQKANTALLMLTDYYSRPELDSKLVDLVLEEYEKVYYWPQGRYDLELPSQKDRPLIRLEPTVEALDEFLQSYGAFDYIGTRLHGGIMCLLARKRSLILEVDNRAREIARDTGLPTTARDNYDYIAHWISNPTPVKITINEAAICRWRSQFGVT
jgi:polysaccharide pyruvyl transferase WcaK-like protein